MMQTFKVEHLARTREGDTKVSLVRPRSTPFVRLYVLPLVLGVALAALMVVSGLDNPLLIVFYLLAIAMAPVACFNSLPRRGRYRNSYVSERHEIVIAHDAPMFIDARLVNEGDSEYARLASDYLENSARRGRSDPHLERRLAHMIARECDERRDRHGALLADIAGRREIAHAFPEVDRQIDAMIAARDAPESPRRGARGRVVDAVLGVVVGVLAWRAREE